MSPTPAFAPYPETPCVGVCRIGDDGYCEGCLRNLDEIAAWASMDECGRVRVYEQLAGRGRPANLWRPKGRE